MAETATPTPTATASTSGFQKKRRRLRRGDIGTSTLDSLSWCQEDCETSLSDIYHHVQADALEALRWYRSARKPKRRIAVAARFLAVLLLGAAGVLPLLDVALAGLTIPPIWISILVAAGGGMLAFDRFHGASSGWIRYIKSEQQLKAAMELFELDWEAERAKWSGEPPTPEQVHAMLQRAREFALKVNKIVEDETAAWVEEFQRSIKGIDEALQAREEAAEAARSTAQPGAVNLVVTNGDQCEEGWQITVDDGVLRLHGTGQSAAVPDLPAGIRVFDVAGTIQGRPRRAQVAATVVPGGIVERQLTLS